MKIFETQVNDSVLEKLIEMSAAWEAEQCCYGYVKNAPSDIEGKRIFLATEGGKILGYLFGGALTERFACIPDADPPYFEIEELYVCPEYRSQGVGRALMSFVEESLKRDGIPYVMLGTATKNYKAILHFYLEEMGMEFWYAQLFKKL